MGWYITTYITQVERYYGGAHLTLISFIVVGKIMKHIEKNSNEDMMVFRAFHVMPKFRWQTELVNIFIFSRAE